MNFQKNCGDGIVLTRQYIFSKVLTNDDIFNALYNGSYSLNNIFVKTVNVDGKSLTYDEVRKLKANQVFANMAPIIKDLTLNHKVYKTADNLGTVLNAMSSG